MRKLIHIASALMAAVLAFISCERADVNRPDVQEGGRPIQFTVESEWPEITKAASTTIDAFKVWGTWTEDPGDDSNTAGIEEIVFGNVGAEVTKDENGTWVLAEETDWYQGYYNFAAVYPTTFSATQAATFTESTTADGQTVQEYANLLTIDLSAGLDLSKNNQTDLMYAFDCVDNSANEASAVGLNFNHAFARLTVELSYSATSPRVNSFAIYGIHSKIQGELKYRQELTVTGGNQVATSLDNLSELLSAATVTTEDSPYYSAGSYTTGSSPITLVENLLVFPETLSETCACVIKINVTIGGQTKDVYANVTSGQWAPGGTYVFKLDADSIVM